MSLREMLTKNDKAEIAPESVTHKQELPPIVSNVRDFLSPSQKNQQTLSPELQAIQSRAKKVEQEQVRLKTVLHEEFLKKFDLTAISRISEAELKQRISSFVSEYLLENKISIGEALRKSLSADLHHEITGLGPLEPLLNDPTISDILVNNHETVYVERKGKLELTNTKFNNEEHLLRIIEKIVSRIGRRVDESSPMVDARLPDGSRVNAIIPPLALDGSSVSIRKFSSKPLAVEDLIRFGAMTENMAYLLAAMVKSGLNIIISGGTGSGKTTMLNMLSSFIPSDERIITIEDAAELRLQQPHVVRLETRPANLEGQGEISQRALFKNTLRMRPDRIIVGEVRGGEVLDLLQAMNTGHDGSMATIHANTARDALTRLENMVAISGLNLPTLPLRQQIVSALSAIIQVNRLTDGKRKLISIMEITGIEGDVISSQEIFKFVQTGVDPDGTVEGHFTATGIRPKFAAALKAKGIVLPDNLFDPYRPTSQFRE
jgi:pilus assembly protein CpaF